MMMIPPPIPNRPERIPAIKPIAMRMNNMLVNTLSLLLSSILLSSHRGAGQVFYHTDIPNVKTSWY